MKDNCSILMAQRLKSIREEKRLSHVALKDALEQKYGIEISRDSLMSYERLKPDDNNRYKNEGMRVEYLRYLADFYGVTADYLLGIDEHRKRNPATIYELGITEESEGIILNRKSTPYSSVYGSFINDMIAAGIIPDVFENYFELIKSLYRPETMAATITEQDLDKYDDALRFFSEHGFHILSPNDTIFFFADKLAESIKTALLNKYIPIREHLDRQ